MRTLQNILIYAVSAIILLSFIFGLWIGLSFLIQLVKSIFDIPGVCPINALAVIPRIFG